jgi:hypothetical protein
VAQRPGAVGDFTAVPAANLSLAGCLPCSFAISLCDESVGPWKTAP